MLRQRTTSPAEPSSPGRSGQDVRANGSFHQPVRSDRISGKGRGGKALARVKSVVFVLLFLLYVVVPVWYGSCTWVRRNFIYLNAVNLVPELNLTHPMESGLACGRNFYLRTEEVVTVGVWHAVPRSLAGHRCDPGNGSLSEAGEFDDDRPVFLHFHGSGGTRGASHRVELHRMLTEKLDAHVVTLDYRGFGDSTPVRPTVAGVVHDASVVYRWLRRRAERSRIHFWAQSLGTGIAVHLAAALPGGEGPVSVVLEAPYTTIPDASREHPYTTLHTFLPFFDFWFVTPARHADTFFDSESRIGNVSAPVLILHAEDDDTIPYKLGRRLYRTALEVRDQSRLPVRMVTYEAHLGYGHKSISSDPALPDQVLDFMRSSQVLHRQALEREHRGITH